LTLEDQDLKQFTLAALRETICYVPQKPLFFDGSVRENLLYANPHASIVDLMRVLRIAHFLSVVDKLPNGLDTQLGPSGHSLSGGELQRLALARALLRDAPILILDETTSALDLPTEQSIFESVAIYRQSRILIIITHRLASISWMKRIVVLNAGQLVGMGDHSLLYRESPLYRRLYEAASLKTQFAL
jgi:ABC-type multidrug transport system fused ATPase/permease subunit